MQNNQSQSESSLKLQGLILAMMVLPFIIILLTTGGYIYLAKFYKRPLLKPATLSQSATNRNPNLAADSYYIGSSSYKGEVSAKSKINKTEYGKLYKFSNSSAGVSFITAMQGDQDVSKLFLSSGWQLAQIGQDSMWIPGACAQKPSWLLQNRYVVIDDGSYESGEASHFYAVYDTKTQKFNDFGGTLVSDTQSREKILYVNVENDKLVFYIDLQDPSGAFASSTNFKHARADREPYIIRRVINVSDLTYDDYRVPYEQPAFNAYYTKVVGDSNVAKLELYTDGHSQYQVGEIKPSQTVTLAKVDAGKLSEAVGSKSKFLDDSTKVYKSGIVDYLNTKLPQYSDLTGTSVGEYFSFGYQGVSADNVFIALPSGNTYGLPAIYNSKSKSLNLITPVDGLKAWSDASAFILGIFTS